MAKIILDDDGFLEEPCSSCDKSYVEDIWYEWCCDEKECPYDLYKAESEKKGMTNQEKDKILKLMVEERSNYAIECEKRITAEQGKIIGADYMLQRFLDVLKIEVEPQESEDKE